MKWFKQTCLIIILMLLSMTLLAAPHEPFHARRGWLELITANHSSDNDTRLKPFLKNTGYGIIVYQKMLKTKQFGAPNTP